MSEMKLTIESLDRFAADTLDMARALDRGERSEHGPVFAFESVEGLLSTLTSNRWAVLRTLRQRGPSSIRALSQALGRDYRAVHADVTALLGAALIERDADGRIFVPWTRISAEFDLESAA
ncbi:putative transcriptional regulator [Kaistia hirudinis]|uniref:Putative transcriptional regulator n=1 Tax=Kaistia hirudinis TaxID=1293440 RepID=A0A840AFG2_9HYPH|nr:winged helix DNA-binding protein [Kaistia hirudinis]MBB3929099.1 putative transcriptional regulator [Kaistia hirudinis]